MQFINGHRGRVIAVNTGANRMVTVLPGQLIDLPLEIGLEVGLTPVDDFRLKEELRAKALLAQSAPVAPEPKRDDDRLLNQLDAAMDAKMENLAARLLGALAGTGGEDLRAILQKLDALKVAPSQAEAVEGTPGRKVAYVPLEEGYREKEIKANTNGLKVESAKAAADQNAADELDALLSMEGEI